MFGIPAFCFNSIVVRLKEREIPKTWRMSPRFQFHSGSIKRWVACERWAAEASFNSIVVRLKACCARLSFERQLSVSIP